MSFEKELIERSNNCCELCSSNNNLEPFEVAKNSKGIDEQILVCSVCKDGLNEKNIANPNHFRALGDTMWSSIPAVQVASYRLLFKLAKNEEWARDLLDILYLDDDILSWAKDGCEELSEDNEKIVVRDSNGNELFDGDTVTIIKDLDVKGANFVAKRGTVVKNISLTSNHEQIEGKVNGTQIVLLTCFLKRV